ncbi:CsgG/HfaB family protein [Aureimonas phyllosphaerae]|uniref:Curli production assembly/transport component CsgG/holdfast attachment protein HfaB n=1 Tax=Aureimonas phyllosphaerae TaxID=1166078 RepID=A0A7W6FTY2_9HYPH|nr:CsgG/HfaB family protein [Aureimonas phyllosphaerae]MBB3934457.1 curli production assembly/transport component CsgG/holdfast attachment protein HfaB [Aureimonas phyllosphaerae]MBB3958327.1 curli production assembly/transport component CsgG/holdfast attachment protein HfaB [Aureimonas phyllosphaerae]SFE95361.1 curli production assembly/transport component CsgG/holdfast attachment protein HfaB [Aureimonas phyllosphaerae]
MISGKFRFAALVSAALTLSNCASVQHEQIAPGEAPVVVGPAVRSNVTPYNEALACLGDEIRSSSRRKLGVAVGDIKDYTGKYNQNEGAAITQGGALMVYSAIGKMNDAVTLHERFDTRVAEAELIYLDRRQLGDGQQYPLGPNGALVPYKPYFGGSIRASDYFIIGGITELNYNISSGGVEANVNLVGPKARVYTLNIAVDLRIVSTETLVVSHTVSMSKQITGYEVGFGIFRFFGSDLFDINLGAKNQEPLQFGVRTTLEAATIELLARTTNVSPYACLETGPKDDLRIVSKTPPTPRLPPPVRRAAVSSGVTRTTGTLPPPQAARPAVTLASPTAAATGPAAALSGPSTQAALARESLLETPGAPAQVRPTTPGVFGQY